MVPNHGWTAVPELVVENEFDAMTHGDNPEAGGPAPYRGCEFPHDRGDAQEVPHGDETGLFGRIERGQRTR